MSKNQGYGKTKLSDNHKKQLATIGASIITVAVSSENPLAMVGATLTAGKSIYEFWKEKPENDLCKKLASDIEEIENPDPEIINHDMIAGILSAAARKIKEKADQNELIPYRDDPYALFRDIWGEMVHKDENTLKAEGYYRAVLRAISKNIQIGENEMQSYLFDMRNEIKSDLKKATEEIIRNTEGESEKTAEAVNRHMDEKISVLTNLIQSQSGMTQNTDLCSDNEEYLDLFKRRLFLDSDNPDITLETMFIPPLVQNGHKKAEDCIVEWYQKADSSCMILYGEAGIGKSSLVAKLISKACDNTDTKDNPDKVPFLAVALRDHCERFSRNKLPDGYSAKDVILKLFNAKNIQELQGKLLILDGFDELTVLSNGFGNEEAKTFINNLAASCKKLKILITSREGYFDNKQLDRSISQETLCWKEEQVADWCKLYGEKNPLRATWCGDFPDQYQNLPRDKDDDKRYQILCIPFILYLCCNSEVNVNENKSIGKIYDKAFRQILLRTHGNQLTGEGRFLTSRTDIERRLVHWQYTKEIAYQMFLQDTLDLSDAFDKKDKRRIGFDNAINRTKQVMEMKGIDLNDTDLFPQEYLSVFRFATKKCTDGKSGISFVHKTVYEYFTAVKLYEDYFAKFSKSYFDKHADENGDYSLNVVHEVMDSFIKAFRYKPIREQDHIFQYLCEMNEPQFNGEERTINEDDRFDFGQYSKALTIGMKQHYLSDFDMPKRIDAYNISGYKNLPISAQLNLSFCNFTWFLTGRGFENSERVLSLNLGDLIGSRYITVNLRKWNLSHTILEKVNLMEAKLEDANLGVADLFLANLQGANLQGANLQSAELQKVNLKSSNLQKANLQGADLQEANLQEADLQAADLQAAELYRAELREADLQEANLQGAKLFRAKLFRAKLKWANLQEANLQSAELQWAKLYGTNLFRAKLFRAELQEANLREAKLQEAYLQEANLREADLQEANLQGANLQGAKLREAKLREAKLQEVKLQEADLQEANLQEANLQEANLQWANLQGAKLQWANLQEADLQGAKLQWAKLQSANLQRVKLQGAKLQEAKLQWAKLQSAKLQSADLQGADLFRANLQGANLFRANLIGANLIGAKLQWAKLQEADLQEANLQEADLKGANLQGANLQWADLQEAKLQGAELHGAKLQRANLQGANLQGAKYCTHPNLCTIFPDGFDPNEHGMIEVDINGNPVK